MQISSTISQYSTAAVNSTSALQDGAANVSAKQQLSALKLESALDQAVGASLTHAPRSDRPRSDTPNASIPRIAYGIDEDASEFGNSIGPATPHKTGSSAGQAPSTSALPNRADNMIKDGEDEFGNSFGVLPNVRPATSSPRPVINGPSLGIPDNVDKFGNIKRPSAPSVAGTSGRQEPPPFTNQIAFGVDEDEGDAAISPQQLRQLGRDTQMLDKLIAALSK